MAPTDGIDFDAIVVVAGFGLRMLHELRELGLTARVLEAGSDLGARAAAGVGLILTLPPPGGGGARAVLYMLCSRQNMIRCRPTHSSSPAR